MNRPAILLADEPTGNLDSTTSEEIMRVFEGLSSSGQTVIMVTHEPDIAAHARRVVVLRDGRISSTRARDTRDVRRLAQRTRSLRNPCRLLHGMSILAASRQIRVQKLKSFFTLLGVTIGVMFLIAVVSIVNGMSKYMEEDFAGSSSA